MSSNKHSLSTKENHAFNRPSLFLIYSLLLVPVGMLVLFNYIPAISAFYHAFTKWDPGAESTWVGFDNFVRMFCDPVMRKSLMNLFKLGCFIFIVNLTVPFIVAEMIFHIRSERWSYLSRVAIVLPMIVPGVVIFLIWAYLYGPDGVVTEVLYRLGLTQYIRGWLSDPKTALLAVAFVGFPFAYGFNVLIYYAGLTNIPNSLNEAASIDGLGGLGRITHIHIPLILHQVKLLIVVTMIGVVNGFESIYILTKDGGPGYETMVPGLYMYLNGFTYNQMGYASAIGLTMLLFLLAFTYLMNRLVPSEEI